MEKLTQNLQRHLEALVYPRHAIKNPEGHERASQYVRSTFQALGYTVEGQAVPYQGQNYTNWVAKLPHSDKNKPTLIVGAHYDSIPDCPGADDNASGVAVLLETARLYREAASAGKIDLKQHVEFVAFDLEECVLVGSSTYASRFKREKRKMQGMLSLEMLGCYKSEKNTQRFPLKPMSVLYGNTGDFVTLVGSIGSSRLLWNAKRAFKTVSGLKTRSLLVPGAGHLIPNIRRSDHAPFWDLHYPALLVTDTSFYRNEHYHTPQDTLDTLDVPFMASITEGLSHLLQF